MCIKDEITCLMCISYSSLGMKMQCATSTSSSLAIFLAATTPAMKEHMLIISFPDMSNQLVEQRFTIEAPPRAFFSLVYGVSTTL